MYRLQILHMHAHSDTHLTCTHIACCNKDWLTLIRKFKSEWGIVQSIDMIKTKALKHIVRNYWSFTQQSLTVQYVINSLLWVIERNFLEWNQRLLKCLKPQKYLGSLLKVINLAGARDLSRFRWLKLQNILNQM